MKFRKLRIAWSVFWGVACVLLVVLWVRSFFATDSLMWAVRDKGWTCLTSRNAGLGFLVASSDLPPMPISTRLTYHVLPRDTPAPFTYHEFAGFEYYISTNGKLFAVRGPYWSLILIAGIMSAVTARGFAWRF